MSFNFDESVHRLAACTFHDNVNGVVRGTRWLRHDLGASANSGNDFVLESCIWNLRWSASGMQVGLIQTYVLDNNHTGV